MFSRFTILFNGVTTASKPSRAIKIEAMEDDAMILGSALDAQNTFHSDYPSPASKRKRSRAFSLPLVRPAPLVSPPHPCILYWDQYEGYYVEDLEESSADSHRKKHLQQSKYHAEHLQNVFLKAPLRPPKFLDSLSDKFTGLKISSKQAASASNPDPKVDNSCIVRDFKENPETFRQAQAFAIARWVRKELHN